jgi:hypothetical protein
MYDKLNQTVYTKSGKNYNKINVFNSVKDEFEAIAGIVAQVNTWTEV